MGHDGSYLAELLLSKGYEVHGVITYSPAEVGHLLGDLSKARAPLGCAAATHWEELHALWSTPLLLESRTNSMTTIYELTGENSMCRCQMSSSSTLRISPPVHELAQKKAGGCGVVVTGNDPPGALMKTFIRW
jgi:hypothetical protein